MAATRRLQKELQELKENGLKSFRNIVDMKTGRAIRKKKYTHIHIYGLKQQRVAE